MPKRNSRIRGLVQKISGADEKRAESPSAARPINRLETANRGAGQREAEGHEGIKEDFAIEGPTEGQNRCDTFVGAGVGKEGVGTGNLRGVERCVFDGGGKQ